MARTPAPADRGPSRLAWDGRSWRLPAWLWVGLLAMFFSALHILLDFGVGLFDLRGTLLPGEAATVVGVGLIQLWWAISFMAGVQGSGGGVASVGILGVVWVAMTNGYPIAFCPPVCTDAWPLSDVAHVGSIGFGLLLPLVAVVSLWRARTMPGLFMPAVATVLSVGTIAALASTPLA